MKEIIQLNGITSGYPGRQDILRELDFTLRPGQRIGLIGPNGCGKSTLLHTIMGLVPIRSGTIRLFGRQVNTEAEFHDARLRLGFLFQHADDQLFSPSVLEDVAFGPLNQGLGRREALDKAMATITRLGLEGFEDRVPYKLSGGEKKLAALATILVMEPDALLLDEPTTGLDKDTKQRILTILQGLDIACLVVSHEPDFLAEATDTLVALRDGQVVRSEAHAHTHVHIHEGGEEPHLHD
ncbi:cobalt/nickel transport system ATP-binding protein [Paucidesulfovibrio gracilis DSM 16080]|uniref:Cobalt/nickel transport system ATP-binding protein n=1 Tax=Paucidesulfovibrio gracilis DSM 16080 TaxID=1121449 RepID=A0A1T4WTB9_9BACT|nr:ABC transporter ATP-binding protein [Paucidesulfovibrio gracilis]SKA80529.1 cobalt/nickel transport system ATP-binding protein [Paucidesulfovibrio gracilis DSM 16080]